MRYASKPTECEAMQWCCGCTLPDCHQNAFKIVAWVNANGGEARYEQANPHAPFKTPCIAIRTINGWAYAAPGHYVVMGSEMFDPHTARLPRDRNMLRDFYPCDPETFEKRWQLKEQQ